MLYLFFIKNSNRNVIVGASTLTAGNIKKGVKIFNVTGTFVGIVDSSYTMYQSGSASIRGFSWKVYTEQYSSSRDVPSVDISSNCIRCKLGYNSYSNVAGIAFDFTGILSRKYVLWVQFKAATNYNWSTDVITPTQVYGNPGFTSMRSAQGMLYTDPTTWGGSSWKFCVDDGLVVRCSGYLGNVEDSPDECYGVGFKSIFSSSSSSYYVWAEIQKIWIQFY